MPRIRGKQFLDKHIPDIMDKCNKIYEIYDILTKDGIDATYIYKDKKKCSLLPPLIYFNNKKKTDFYMDTTEITEYIEASNAKIIRLEKHLISHKNNTLSRIKRLQKNIYNLHKKKISDNMARSILEYKKKKDIYTYNKAYLAYINDPNICQDNNVDYPDSSVCP